MEQKVTFIFGDDGTAYLYQGNQIIASSKDLDELEKLADTAFGQGAPMGGPSPTPQMPCVNCNRPDCPGCAGQNMAAPAGGQMGNPMPAMASVSDKELDKEEDERLETDDPMKIDKATHVITPNGVKGRIVGKAKGMWGDEVTVRFENGRIASYNVFDNLTYEQEVVKTSKFQTLKDKLEEVPVVERRSLLARIEDLKEIRKQARLLAVSAPYLDAQELDDIVLTASHEIKEAADVIEAMDNEWQPETPAYQAVEQTSIGGGDASFLYDVVEQALAEAQATDYDQLMDEGPETLVAEIDTPVLNDQEAVHNIANEFVTSHTVGLRPDAVQAFRQAFLARIEDVRIKEATARTDEYQRQTHSAQKTAKTLHDEVSQIPDEGLYL